VFHGRRKELTSDGTGDLINRLQLFQKRLKYGLPTETTIVLYEFGFSDRVISQDLTASMNLSATQKKDLVKALKQNRRKALTVIKKYPAYFNERMNELLG
jgi:POLQ-like helicase